MLIALACVLSLDSGEEPLTCDDHVAALDAEYASIAACTEDAECGQVLSGTSCGCTRDLVARNDADTSTYRALQAEAAKAECGGGTSVCDCPEAHGFECAAGVCAWNYADGAYLPDCTAAGGAATTIDGLSISGDTLSVAVSYGGGCATHTFTLCWPDDSFLESNPVQAALELHHDDGGDTCEAWISETVTLSLTPLADAWHNAYGAGSGTIVVNLGGHQASYTF